MYTVYRVNTDELSQDFLDALKTLFKHKTIEIAVCEAELAEQDETAYLLGNPANRAYIARIFHKTLPPKHNILI